METQKCHDCEKELVNNEEAMKYSTSTGDFYKCKNCHQADPTLRNFQKTEVYSRIVGYMRPVEQWNAGKAEEYKDRKEYSLGCC